MILAYICTLAVIAWLGYACYFLFKSRQELTATGRLYDAKYDKVMIRKDVGHH